MPPETVWSQRGSIAADGHAALIARLSSLCDGCPAYTEQLHYHDRVYTAEKATRTQGSVSLRAREHLNTGESELVYWGPLAVAVASARNAMPAGGGGRGGATGRQGKRAAKTTTSQARILVETGPSLAAFVEAMGLEYDRELLRKGVQLRYNGIIDVTVTQLYKLATEGDVSTAELINSYYLVEASGTGAEEKVVPSLDSLMAQLKPLVHLQPWG